MAQNDHMLKRILKISGIVLVVATILQGFGYLNLMVSYKYEVDLMETNITTDNNLSPLEKIKRLEQMQVRKQEIMTQKKWIKFLFWGSLLGCIIIIIVFKTYDWRFKFPT